MNHESEFAGAGGEGNVFRFCVINFGRRELARDLIGNENDLVRGLAFRIRGKLKRLA